MGIKLPHCLNQSEFVRVALLLRRHDVERVCDLPLTARTEAAGIVAAARAAAVASSRASASLRTSRPSS
jgi:hypothetical protein